MTRGKLVAAIGFVLAWILISAGVCTQQTVDAQDINRAGLVVNFGDHYETYCVEFSESEITGYDLLRRAGLSLVVSGSGGMGFAVCDINETSGCSASNCFCKCQGSACNYWSYHHLTNGSWQYSQLGASSYKVHNGDVEGWGWGEGVINSSGAQPPVIPFDQICAPPATETPTPPTNTPLPTNTPIPSTDTPVPAPDAWFRLDDNPITAGLCTMLRWDTSNAREVTLDGEKVGLIGSREVCPTVPTDYELRVVGFEEEETFRLTLGVTGSAATVTSTPLSTATQPSASSAVGQGAATLPPSSPALEATESSSSTPTGEPTVSPLPLTSAPAPSATPAQVVQSEPTPTATQVAQAEEAEGQSIGGERAPASAETASPSPVLPVGYIVFSLIIGGLLGWLIHILRLRGKHA